MAASSKDFAKDFSFHHTMLRVKASEVNGYLWGLRG